MSLILLAGTFFLIYCIVISLIAWGVWSTSKPCSDLAGYYAGALVAGFLLTFTTIVALPNEDKQLLLSSSPRVNYNCADTLMTPIRQLSMNEFMKDCIRNEGISTCTQKAKELFCTPIIEVPKQEPVNVPL